MLWTRRMRLEESDDGGGVLRIFAVWGRDPANESYSLPVFKVGEGIAGRVARDRVPVMTP